MEHILKNKDFNDTKDLIENSLYMPDIDEDDKQKLMEFRDQLTLENHKEIRVKIKEQNTTSKAKIKIKDTKRQIELYIEHPHLDVDARNKLVKYYDSLTLENVHDVKINVRNLIYNSINNTIIKSIMPWYMFGIGMVVSTIVFVAIYGKN
jgi:hypothetical protein